MATDTFSKWSKEHAKMSRRGVLSVKQRVINYYRSLYDVTFGKNMFLVFFATLTEPPMTFAKVSTYLLVTVVLSTGVYASIAPSSFSRASTAVKETVQTAIKTSIDTFIPSGSRGSQGEDVLREDDSDDERLKIVIGSEDDNSEDDNSEDDSGDVREDDDEVFCDGERRDAEDCAKRENKRDTDLDDERLKIVIGSDYNSEDDNRDVREDDDEVFCDGERRDAKDCAKRIGKDDDDLDDKRVEVIIGNSDDNSEDDSGDVREDDDEVFCDGERRDAEDCAKRENKRDDDLDDKGVEVIIGNSDDNSEDDNGDVREDDDEVFCDGERRDAKDCTERIAKDADEDKDTSEDADQDKDEDEDDSD